LDQSTDVAEAVHWSRNGSNTREQSLSHLEGTPDWQLSPGPVQQNAFRPFSPFEKAPNVSHGAGHVDATSLIVFNVAFVIVSLFKNLVHFCFIGSKARAHTASHFCGNPAAQFAGILQHAALTAPQVRAQSLRRTGAGGDNRIDHNKN
jgi:hypothetical protein